jgi:hypothetical protein
MVIDAKLRPRSDAFAANALASPSRIGKASPRKSSSVLLHDAVAAEDIGSRSREQRVAEAATVGPRGRIHREAEPNDRGYVGKRQSFGREIAVATSRLR